MSTPTPPSSGDSAPAQTGGDKVDYWCHMCQAVVEISVSQEAVDGEIHCPQCGDSFVELYEPSDANQNTNNNQTAQPANQTGAPPPNDLPQVHPLSQLLQSLLNPQAAQQPAQPANANNEDGTDSDGESEMYSTDEEDEGAQGQQQAPGPQRQQPNHWIAQLMNMAFPAAGVAAGAGGGPQVDINVNGVPFNMFGQVDPFQMLAQLGNQQGMGGNFGDYYHGPGFEQFISQFIDGDNPFGTPPTDPSYLRNMKPTKATAEQVASALECNVCQDTFKEDEDVHTLPCDHTFHTDCLEPWLKDHSNCPNCRYQLPWEGMPTQSQ